MKEIADKLKALRLENRFTLKQLAAKTGCTDREINHEHQERKKDKNQREHVHWMHDLSECVFFLS